MNKINIKEILEKDGEVRKFVGVAPDGFILVCEKTLEDLKDFDKWKDWKNGLISIEEMNKLNFPDT
jgi:hypothetical protein